ncbi:MAG: DUF5668 domain-containing protein [Candidatus Gracilibacteria bacterium]
MCDSSSRDSHLWLGLVAFVIGAVLLLQRFDLVPAETWNYLWPSILVVTGLKLMMFRGHGCCCSDDSCEMPMPVVMPKKSAKKKKKHGKR